ncbi:MAG: tyrosine-type recombinase/integrase, partial [Actinomycetota bacterium]|nr:tyrosine-type recombinase/integrase [Actinomycetota bacterium]
MANGRTLSILAEQFLTEKVARKELDPMSARNRRSALRVFVAAVGDMPIRDLTTEHIGIWIEARADLAPATRRAHWSALKTFLAWARASGHMKHDPLAGLPSPRQPRAVPRALHASSVGKLLVICPDARGRAIVWLMVGMGLRCVEVSRAQLGDWDRDRKLLTIRGKGSHERVVPVPPRVALAIREYLKEQPSNAGPLIRSKRQPNSPLTPDTISGMVSEWMGAAKVKRLPRDGNSAHALRHTAASDVLDACGDLRVVQEMLGHSQL